MCWRPKTKLTRCATTTSTPGIPRSSRMCSTWTCRTAQSTTHSPVHRKEGWTASRPCPTSRNTTPSTRVSIPTHSCTPTNRVIQLGTKCSKNAASTSGTAGGVRLISTWASTNSCSLKRRKHRSISTTQTRSRKRTRETEIVRRVCPNQSIWVRWTIVNTNWTVKIHQTTSTTSVWVGVVWPRIVRLLSQL